MSFAAYQGEVDPAHLLPLDTVPVQVDWAAGRVASVAAGQGGNAQARRARVFVNEGSRDVIVRFGGGGTTSSVTGGPSGGTVHAGATRSWRVAADADNLPADHVDQDARLPTSDTQGPEVRLTVSGAGLDRFFVFSAPAAYSGRSVPSGTPVLVVEVCKRITYHYVKMLSSSGTPLQFDNTLRACVDHFASEYGIVLEQVGEPTTVPHRDPLARSQVASHAGATHHPGPREIWIMACAGISGAVGLGGNHCVSVDVTHFLGLAPTYQQLQTNVRGSLTQTSMTGPAGTWASGCTAQGNGPGTPTRGVCMALERHDPRDIILRQIKATLLHEVAHVLGLVPRGAAWEHHGQGVESQHCSDRNCAMWHEVETGGASYLESHDQLPHFHGDFETGCSLWLVNAALTSV